MVSIFSSVLYDLPAFSTIAFLFALIMESAQSAIISWNNSSSSGLKASPSNEERILPFLSILQVLEPILFV